MKTTHIVIFASGSGSNAEAICRHFATEEEVHICAIVSNRADAGVHHRAETLGIPSYHFSTKEMIEGTKPLDLLRQLDCNLIILAGYMCLITKPYFDQYQKRILNIHPALLPSYGGKGMYGQHVHEDVIRAGEKISGITIHLVDEEYDHGRTLCQATCPVEQSDTPDSLAARIHHLEHRFYPIAIEQYLQELSDRVD